jgi:hypothetical protein
MFDFLGVRNGPVQIAGSAHRDEHVQLPRHHPPWMLVLVPFKEAAAVHDDLQRFAWVTD